MPLYSLIIEHGGKSYGTQLVADSATKAINQYFAKLYLYSGMEFFGGSAPQLTINDIIYVTPMEGLVNILLFTSLWLALVCFQPMNLCFNR